MRESLAKKIRDGVTAMARSPRRPQFSVSESLRCLCVVAVALAVTIAVPPRAQFSGPLFLVAQGDSFKGYGYGCSISILLLVGLLFVQPAKWSAIASIIGAGIWVASGVVFRCIADW